MPLETLYDPLRNPVSAVNTAQSPMSLPPGVLSASSNLRFSDGVIQCRNGMSSTYGVVVNSSTFRGIWAGPNNVTGGGDAILIAVLVSAAVRVYRSINSGDTWTELTTASGQYGDTRMSDAFVNFEVVPYYQNGAMQYIVANNGTDYPRVFGSGGDVYIHSPIDIPLYAGSLPVKYTVDRFLTVSNASTTTYAMTDVGGAHSGIDGADATLSGGTANVDNVNRFTITTASVVDGDTAACTFSAAVGLGGSARNACLLVGVDTALTDPWQYLKLEVHSAAAGAYAVLFDPTDQTKYPKPVPVPFDNSQRNIWVFDTSPLGTDFTWGNGTLDGYRLTYKDPVSGATKPTGNPTVDIFLMAIGGDYSGSDDFAMSLEGGNFLESPGVIYSNWQTPKLRDIGGPQVLYGSANLPRSPLIKFMIQVPFRDVSTSDLARGVITLNVYRKQAGARSFYYQTFASIGTYDAVTDNRYEYISTGTATASTDIIYKTVNSQASVTSGTRRLPSAFHLPIPKGKGMKWTNGRLFVGSTDAAVAGIGFSEHKNAFRFIRVLQLSNGEFDEDSPGVIDLMGETAVAFASVNSSLIGSNQIFGFTRNGVYAFGGVNTSQLIGVSRVSRFGTISPLSIQELNGKLFYLDTEMQVRMFAGGQSQDITRGVIDDQLAAIPAARRPYVVAAVNREFYYLAHSPTGATTNTRILVWDDVQGMWCRDTPKVAAEGLITCFDATLNAKRLMLIGGANLDVYEYDISTEDDDDGTAIACSMTFWEMHQPDGKNFSINRVGITADDVSSGTGTITRLYKPNAVSATSSISLDATGSQIVRYDGTQTGASKGVTCLLTIAMNLTAGKRIYKIVAEIEPRDHAYDTSG